MRFMILRMADAKTEAGVLPDQKVLAAMGKYMEDMQKAGILLGGEGLKPTSQGSRVQFSGGKPRVIDGPFAEVKELIGGYTMIEVRSKEEAVEWARRWPPIDGDVVLEVRQLFEADDFGPEFTPELREAEERMRSKIAGKP